MILVDGRTGSAELAPALQKRGLPVQTTTLDYGDLAWVGNGPDGPIFVGIEFKKLKDALSCIISKRFAGHQLRGMQANYGFRYLMIEGGWRAADDGTLQEVDWHGYWKPVEVGRKSWQFAAFEHWLMDMRVQGGMEYERCFNRAQTLATIHARYSWWREDWADHKAHRALDQPLMERLDLGPVRPVVSIANGIPGLGWERVNALAKVFTNPEALWAANEKEIATVPGIGPTLAKRAWAWLHKA